MVINVVISRPSGWPLPACRTGRFRECDARLPGAGRRIIGILACLSFLLVGVVWAMTIDYREGSWSESVNGLRGRLIVEQKPKINDSVIIGVSLELQNDSNELIAILADPERIESELFNGAGKPVLSRTDSPRSGPVPYPEWKAIPSGKSIKFSIESYTVGVPKGVTFIAFHDKVWTINSSGKDLEYFLRGIFNHTKDDKDNLSERWSGTLNLPFVKIRAK